jgi:hypothetical protein
MNTEKQKDEDGDDNLNPDVSLLLPGSCLYLLALSDPFAFFDQQKISSPRTTLSGFLPLNRPKKYVCTKAAPQEDWGKEEVLGEYKYAL